MHVNRDDAVRHESSMSLRHVLETNDFRSEDFGEHSRFSSDSRASASLPTVQYRVSSPLVIRTVGMSIRMEISRDGRGNEDSFVRTSKDSSLGSCKMHNFDC